MKHPYTLVVGVDKNHLKQLKYVWPTWQKHKPSTCRQPMVVFFDKTDVQEDDVLEILEGHPQLTTVPWPPNKTVYEGNPNDKWYHPQRYKMLAGFVHLPGMVVKTPYWLKVDTDVVATGVDDWTEEEWFNGKYECISHRWGYTKPPNQILLLDDWVERNRQTMSLLAHYEPLKLAPDPGSDIVKHARIISWCSIWGTAFTRWAAEQATKTCGPYKLPVPSQDGFLWYMATRMGMGIIRENMKDRGWHQWSTNRNVREKARESLDG